MNRHSRIAHRQGKREGQRGNQKGKWEFSREKEEKPKISEKGMRSGYQLQYLIRDKQKGKNCNGGSHSRIFLLRVTKGGRCEGPKETAIGRIQSIRRKSLSRRKKNDREEEATGK